jgi:hypothetical protein
VFGYHAADWVQPVRAPQSLAAGTSAPAAQPPEDVAATLRKLASLHDEGLLTDEEFAAKRAEVIARI